MVANKQNETTKQMIPNDMLLQQIKEPYKITVNTRTQIIEHKVYSDVGEKGLYAFFLHKYIIHHIMLHEDAMGLFNVHNVNQGTSSVIKQYYKTRTNTLLIVKGTESQPLFI